MESNAREKLQGIFVPLATPFKDNEDLDTDALSHNLALYGDTALRGFVVLGSNGECKSLDDAEKATVLETVLAEANERMTITVGVMYETSRHAERFIRRIADLGADFALVQSPSYFKKQLTDDALYAYFSGLADRAAIPLLIYHCPGFNGILLSFDLLEKLSAHPNIAGMKDSAPGCDLKIMQLNRDSFHVMAGSVAKLSEFVERGSVGGTISVANYAPGLAVELYQCLCKRGSAGCVDLNRKVIGLNQSVSGDSGVPGVKAAMNLLRFRGGIPRRPLLPLQAGQIKGIESALAEAGVLNK